MKAISVDAPARLHLYEKKSSLGGQGLFTSHHIRKGALVAFLTGEWGLFRDINKAFPPGHVSLSYVADWDTVTAPGKLRSKQTRTDTLSLISRTQQSSPKTPLRRAGDDVIDVGALLNALPVSQTNCRAESVAIEGKHVSGGSRRKGLRYPAIVLRARRHISADEELTWPYDVPGMGVLSNAKTYIETEEKEASASSSVLELWRSARSQSRRLIPLDACGPPVEWDDNWVLLIDSESLRPLSAHLTVPAVKQCAPRDEKQECLKKCRAWYKGSPAKVGHCIRGSRAWNPNARP